MAMAERLKAAIRRLKVRHQDRLSHKQERKVAAREKMRYPGRKDLPTGFPNIGG
jgi:hypothetical protein